MRDQEILGLSESYNQVIANEIELEEKSGSPRPTFMPKSRERDIGKHDDWKDKPAEDWNDKTSEQKKADKLRRRASAVVQTQRRQDRETNVREEVLSYLLDEGFASDEKSAEAIMDAMSEAWIESIVEEVLDERNRGEEGMSDREVSRRRNLGGNTRSKVSSSSLGDHGPQGAIQKFHNAKSKQRQAIHKTARGVRGDTGESGGKGRYEANKDHADGYPSITKRGQGPS